MCSVALLFWGSSKTFAPHDATQRVYDKQAEKAALQMDRKFFLHPLCPALFATQSHASPPLADAILVKTYQSSSDMRRSQFWIWVYNDSRVLDLAVSPALRREGVFHPEVMNEILFGMRQGPAGGMLWDIGANIGSTSFHVAAHGYRVVAFEPHPYNAMLFLLGQCSNSPWLLDNVTLIPVALGQTNSLCHGEEDPVNPANYQIDCENNNNGEGGDGGATIPTYRLDDPEFSSLLLSTPPTVIKLDVQGFEHYVVLGAQAILQQVRAPFIVTEFDVDLLRKRKSNPRELLAFWEDLGYQIHFDSFRGPLFVRDSWDVQISQMQNGHPTDLFLTLS